MTSPGDHRDCWFGKPCAIGRPAECPPCIAEAKRRHGSPWAAIDTRVDDGGPRHYLNGRAVHCGDVVELQAQTVGSDDYGEYTVHVQEGAPVRYEAICCERRLLATLYTRIGGHEFVATLEPWMRFRWPEEH